MKLKANRTRTIVPRIATAMLVAGALHASTATAAPYQFRVPAMGLTVSPTAQSQQVVTEILVALTGGPALPPGEVNSPYSYDLKQLLSVTGDSAYSASNVAWSISSGALPEGLGLGSDGVVSGTPTAKNTTGSSFQIRATYKTKEGQQAYTIVVNGAVLHVTQIASGYYHSCAVTTAGGLKCWGVNTSGQLGDNSSTQRLSPVDVVGLTSGVALVAAENTNTCAVTTAGSVKCWGDNEFGQLGNGRVTASKVPVDVTGLSTGVVSLAIGYRHACALTGAGDAKCWGDNSTGQLGNNSSTSSSVPVDVYGLAASVASVVAGGNHTCAVTKAGGAKCWGYGTYSMLGDGTQNARYAPVDVVGLSSGVAQLLATSNNTCALTTAGGVKCWGFNGQGQVGDGTKTQRSTPVDVTGLTAGVTKLALGGGASHHCAITDVGGLKCWGANTNGALGDSSTTNRLVPVDVAGLAVGVTSVSVGYRHTCAVASGAAKCWGANSYGQVGDKSTTQRLTPVEVTP